jgi:hypothetical protein
MKGGRDCVSGTRSSAKLDLVAYSIKQLRVKQNSQARSPRREEQNNGTMVWRRVEDELGKV